MRYKIWSRGSICFVAAMKFNALRSTKCLSYITSPSISWGSHEQNCLIDSSSSLYSMTRVKNTIWTFWTNPRKLDRLWFTERKWLREFWREAFLCQHFCAAQMFEISHLWNWKGGIQKTNIREKNCHTSVWYCKKDDLRERRHSIMHETEARRHEKRPLHAILCRRENYIMRAA